jgi:hypothetical protein
MSTSKRRAVDDVSEQGDASILPGAPDPLRMDRISDAVPCPTMSCPYTGEFHSSAPPAAPEAQQSFKVQKSSCTQGFEQDMEGKKMDIAHTTNTVRYHHGELCMRAL